MGTVLKALLQQRHLQTVSSFNRHYDQLARKIEPELVGAGPKKAQFYRWLSGDMTGLPYPHHCRILRAMFPDWSVSDLFREYVETEFAATSAGTDRQSRTADVEAIFPTRTDFVQSMPPNQFLRATRHIDAMGLSLNLLCQQVHDSTILGLVESGTAIRCLFLNPHGVHVRSREVEEGHETGILSSLTELNIRSLQRIRRRATPDAAGRIELRTYDQPVRFNITIVDAEMCIVQPYLPNCRGVESPTFVCRKSLGPGLFDSFAGVFAAMWGQADPVDAQ